MAPADLLGDVIERTVLAEHPGMSGAALERVRLRDGRALVVKRISPESDLTLGLTGGSVAAEYLLWRSGALDQLPAGVGHAVIDGWVEDEITVLVMRDLGGTMLTWEDRLSTDRCRWMVDRIAALHRRFLDHPPVAVPPPGPVLGLFAPTRIAPLAGENALLAAALRGWEYFSDHVPAEVVEPVLALLEDPGPLAAALAARPVTLVHGDLATVNMAVDDDELVLIDWAMPSAAPGALDIARFLVGCASVVEPSREAVIEMYARAAGPAYDDTAMRLALLSALVWLGWNKTLDIVESPDEALRAREKADLAWWVTEARRTLESGAL